ncbi:MAG: ferrous iron transport protein B [Bacteroidales bacterium]|nr:ferrous iron transport protein B [Bacteroidales bacterium]
MTLHDLNTGDSGIITKVRGRGAFRKRILEMGFLKGQQIHVIKKAPLKDPVVYKIMDSQVSLRQSEAKLIDVIGINSNDSENLINENISNSYFGTFERERIQAEVFEKKNTIEVALVGNPNCGKTTLFNHASGKKEHTGNYAGVTVESKTASVKHNNYKIQITDLPGTYSISAYSPEEIYVREHILFNKPDIVVNVVDASNLKRNLYLSTQLIDMDIKVVIALNMYDELEKKGDVFDYIRLGKMIGIPIIPTVASRGNGLEQLFTKLIDVYEDNEPTIRHIHINYGEDIERSIHKIQKVLRKYESLSVEFSTRFFAIKLLEKDKQAWLCFDKNEIFLELYKTTEKEIQILEEYYKEDSETLITDAKYGFIEGALNASYKTKHVDPHTKTRTDKIDSLLTGRFTGFPIFLFFLWLMFETTYSLGQFPMAWIESGIGLLSEYLNSVLTNDLVRDLVVGGIIGGVGGVLIFLPNILILFLFISFMEDTGYMSRVALLMDKLMHYLGLHGKSFVPMVMGFGCNVPAIMATRTLENRNDRLLTMLIIPFMTCSARLPVYLLIAGAIFPKYAAMVIFVLYLAGMLFSVITAIFLNKTLFRKKEVPFVMELPPYRIPTMKASFIHMWFKGSQYLKKMGGLILIASIIIWALEYFPREVDFSKDYEAEISNLENHIQVKSVDAKIAINSDDSLQITYHEQLTDLQLAMENERREKSYIGKLGHSMAPILEPLGFDWRMGVAILTGIAAKEIVISTMGVLYQADGAADENSQSLIASIQSQKHTSGNYEGEIVFKPHVALAFLVFILLYFPCIAVVAAIKKESGKWKFAVFSVVYSSAMAWIAAFIIFRVGEYFY